MPKIPEVTAEVRGGRIGGSPDYIRGGDNEAGQGIARAGLALADSYATIQGHLEDQKADFEFAKAKTDYTTSYEAAKQDAQMDPEVRNDPAKYETFVTQRLRDNVDTIRKGLTTKNGSAYFSAYVQNKFPIHAVEARGEGLKLQGEQDVAQLQVFKQEWSQLAAESGSDEERRAYMSDYKGMVDRAFERGFLKAGDREKELTQFHALALEKGAAYDARTNVDGFRINLTNGVYEGVDTEKLAKIAERADADEHRVETRTKQVNDAAHAKIMDYLISGAATGQLGDDMILSIVNREIPFLKAEDGLKLAQIKEHGIGGSKDRAVEAMKQDYTTMTGTRTLGDIERFKARLRDHILNNGGSTTATQFGAYLNEQITSVRNTNATELNATLKYAEEKFKGAQAIRPNFMRDLDSNRSQVEMHQILERLRNGKITDPREADRIVNETLSKKVVKPKSSQDTLMEDALGGSR